MRIPGFHPKGLNRLPIEFKTRKKADNATEYPYVIEFVVPVLLKSRHHQQEMPVLGHVKSGFAFKRTLIYAMISRLGVPRLL